jgi:hypothetical protein
MTFCKGSTDDMPLPKRALQRTPPKANPPRNDVGAMPIKGPVRRSPPRNTHNPSIKKVDERNYDYLDNLKIDSTIEKKEKLRRSPVDQNRNTDFIESPAPVSRASERHESAPLNINPLKTGNELVQQPDFFENDAFLDMSPQKPFYQSPQTHKVHYDTSELTNFEDRVDGLL